MNGVDPAGTSAEVVVVGAGAAGLACASTLARAGRSVLVLEAAPRIGGRIRTVRGASGAVWELGAQVVHDRGNPIWRHFPVGPLDPFSDSDFRVLLSARPMPMFALATLDPPPWMVVPMLSADGTVPPGASPASWLAGRSARTSRICTQWLAHDWASDPAELDVTELLEIAGAPGAVGDEGVVRGGFGGLVDVLAGGLQIRSSTAVHRVRQVSGGVVAETTGGSVSAAAAVITVPPWAMGPGALEIDDLPAEKRSAAAALRGGDAVVVVLSTSAVAPGTTSVFDADTGWGFLRAQRGSGEVQVVAKGFAAQRLRQALTGVDEDGAPATEAARSRLRELQNAVTAAFPWLAGAEFGPVTSADWGAEPFLGGAFTAPTTGRSGHSAAWSRPMGARIFFAGESASGARGVGRVHGALATGRRAALEYLAASPQPGREALSLMSV